MEKFAKIYRLGGEVKTFEVGQYESVEAAIKGAGFEVNDGEAVRVNGEIIEDASAEDLNEGDVIVLVPQVKGGIV